MTAAYDLFLREFNATGRESMDGMSVYHLTELSEAERPVVEQTLITAFRQRNARTPRSLAFIAPTATTRQRLEQVLQVQATTAEPADAFTLECAYALLSFTDHVGALDVLEHKAREDDDLWLCGLAMEGLLRSVPTTDASERLAGIVRTAHESLRLSAADAVLMRHGWRLEDPDRKTETLALLRAMIGDDTAARDGALLKVLRTPPRTWPA